MSLTDARISMDWRRTTLFVYVICFACRASPNVSMPSGPAPAAPTPMPPDQHLTWGSVPSVAPSPMEGGAQWRATRTDDGGTTRWPSAMLTGPGVPDPIPPLERTEARPLQETGEGRVAFRFGEKYGPMDLVLLLTVASADCELAASQYWKDAGLRRASRRVARPECDRVISCLSNVAFWTQDTNSTLPFGVVDDAGGLTIRGYGESTFFWWVEGWNGKEFHFVIRNDDSGERDPGNLRKCRTMWLSLYRKTLERLIMDR